MFLNLKEKGIYKITCKINNKVYIGSTWQSFIKRFWQHEWELTNNRHKNQYLQNTWNKYGKEAFHFEILEIVTIKERLLEREDYWLNFYSSCNNEKGFNINPSATGGIQFTKESINKRKETFKATINTAMSYYYNIKSETIIIDDVPKKYRKIVESRLNSTAWNKGKTSKEIDYSFLKNVSKTITNKVIIARKKRQQVARNKSRGVIVYNCLGIKLGTFRSPIDLEEFSYQNPDYFPILPSNKGRNNIPLYVLKEQNIVNCCRGDSKHYKGLMFRYANSSLPVVPLTINDFTRNLKKITELYCRLKEQSLSENPGKNLEA